MASNAEILALQAIGGDWGCDLVNDTEAYTPPPGYAIKSVVTQEETVIASAYQWTKVKNSITPVLEEITSADKNWIGATLALGALITLHDLYPLGEITLTSGAVMVYFCKGPGTASTLGTTTTTEAA